jgi:hypothetical protein
VSDGGHRYALCHEDLGRQVHSGVSLRINQDCIALSYQDREGSQMPKCRRRRHDDIGVEDSLEALFEFGVQADRGIRRGRGEHGSEAIDRVFGSRFEPGIGVEPHVGAGSKVDKAPAPGSYPGSIEVAVLHPQSRKPALLRRADISFE